MPSALVFGDAVGKDKFLLGGKGYGLVEMTSIGLPVPPGFIVTTDACKAYYSAGGRVPSGLFDEVRSKVSLVEEGTGKKFGDVERPLLFSVRSGAPFSMPGMMDTILNLGLNDAIAARLAESGDSRFVYDSYRRLVQMFGKVAMGVDARLFEEALQLRKKQSKATVDADLSSADMKDIAARFKDIVKEQAGRDFPQDPMEQLEAAVEAVFRSWNNPRAQEYRKFYAISDDLGTAVTIQSMVFGNRGPESGSGVGFTRNPSTGEKKLFGEYLPDSQGEDVVSGMRTPLSFEQMEARLRDQLADVAKKLEAHFRDLQDFEFTVEDGKLFLLQTRNAKRTAEAAVKVAVDMSDEGLITDEEAVMRVEPAQLDALLHRRLDPGEGDTPIAKGLNASPGAASGVVVFDTDEAASVGGGQKVILVRPETTPEDIKGMIASQGVLTARGGMTSHAAVVARGMGKPAVVGCSEIEISSDNSYFVTKNGERVSKGEVVTLDGTTGNIYRGEIRTVEPELSKEFGELLRKSDGIRRLGVWANADTGEGAARAKGFGAEGIGLCRTERMFNDPSRLPTVRAMIMSRDAKERKERLYELFPFQLSDFREIFSVMSGKPVVVRLLDLPLHEFLPSVEELILELQETRESGGGKERLEQEELMLARVRLLSEHNPMLGHRGCRLAITYPEIYEMQTKAILQAALEVLEETGSTARVKIMFPLVTEAREFNMLKAMVDSAAREVFAAKGRKLPYQVGTMIETPRAALTAGELGKVSDFFSFGTNDLTQTTFGFSRDDVESKFIPYYLEVGIMERSPFDSVDVRGVGRLVRLAVDEGRKANPELEVGICGEHGGDPASIAFFNDAGLDYVSCSGFRVPIARLSAARAAARVAKTSTTA